jgi:hypothetical protein
MLDLRAPHGANTEIISYTNFQGIIRARSRIALENRDEQALWSCVNAKCDWRGYIERDPAFIRYAESNTQFRVETLRHFTPNEIVWIEQQENRCNLSSSRGHFVEGAFSPNKATSLAMFRGRVFAMCQDNVMHIYNGVSWKRSNISEKPAFAIPISNRFVIAGMKEKPTELLISRVNNADVFPNEESASNTAVTRAVFIDIANQIGTADYITGLGQMEINRLAVFTQDQVIVYITDPDFTKWTVDSRANVRIGCISHRTIANAGSDLLFCSRHGVHSLMRQGENGINITEETLSHQIENLYRHMVENTNDPTMITACYDQDEGQYHIFFPREREPERLTLSFRRGYEDARWTQGSGDGALCADSLGGRYVVGTIDGIVEQVRSRVASASLFRPKMTILTPVLWHGSLSENKESIDFYLQAAGQGRVIVTLMDEESAVITSKELFIEAPLGDTDEYPYIANEHVYRMFFQAKYRGLQVQIESADEGDIEIYAIGLDVRKSGQSGNK